MEKYDDQLIQQMLTNPETQRQAYESCVLQ